MTAPIPCIHVVDDDDSFRAAVMRLLRAAGYEVLGYPSAGAFLLGEQGTAPGCVVLDVNMPGPSGLDLQAAFAARADALPIIFLTGRGDIPLAVSAMKEGASDFFTKPVDGTSLLGAVERALQQNLANRRQDTEHANSVARYESLTPREREVLPMLASGLLNKQVAFELRITEYTVQLHRGHIMRKMKADSFAALVRMADKVCLHIPDRQESPQRAALTGVIAA